MKIINNIEEKRVDFKVATLLKKCGFIYSIQPYNAIFDLGDNQPMYNVHSDTLLKSKGLWVGRPTQQQAIDWILANFNIHIELCRDEDNWKCELYSINSGNKHIPTGFKNYNTPEEAKDAAIEFVLKNIINENNEKTN